MSGSVGVISAEQWANESMSWLGDGWGTRNCGVILVTIQACVGGILPRELERNLGLSARTILIATRLLSELGWVCEVDGRVVMTYAARQLEKESVDDWCEALAVAGDQWIELWRVHGDTRLLRVEHQQNGRNERRQA